ncbi:ABC transporter ATP-binding protein [Phytopseudomonas punonensis]|uniref:Peptide/nickel transport system ATP-binding protein n=1 Tax=Phytopseudomonas punonensis TaxID=1220495 RepID=A0A1M7MZM3_9GAMM|nr:ATP-binding cassette domain-containing protein [Pseudomonas punonensis]SHM96670.1 peptide/nickel transport system ATP-binding protein [Pseudomonas punonensis]
MKPLLSTRSLAIRTATAQLVEPLSVDLWPGKVLTIIGETGSGKSLFAQGIVGNLPAGLSAHGEIELAGGLREQGQASGRRAAWGRELAVLPQEPWLSLDPTMRAIDQVAETYRYVVGKSAQESRQQSRQDLTQLGIEQAEAKFPFQLSGGMAQRLAFAATHAGGAKVMIADEPTKGLDSARIGEVINLLQAGIADGGTLLIITHDIEVARRLGGEVMIMLKGQVIESGSATQVLDAPTHEYTRRLLAADPSRWPRREPSVPSGEPVVQVRNLAVERGDRVLFEGLSFDARPGEVVGVTGPSGCGKSTLGDVILGLMQARSGSVGKQRNAPRVAFQKLYQDPVAAFPPTVTLGRCLADLVKLHRLDASRIDALLARLRLDRGLLDRLPGNVSGGELQRFSLLRVLLLDPVFIFADEPSSRLDLITQQEMIELLVETARERRTAVLLVSHDEALIEAVADQRIRLGH